MANNGNKTKYFSARRIATLSVLTAMGLIMFMIESLFPPLFLPGAKMGLSNIFSLLALFILGPAEAIILVVVRTVLGSIFMGNMSTLLYSFTAGLVSVVISSLLVNFVYPRVSVIAVSVVAAVMHNLAQNLVFCLVSDTPEMFGYMPYLALLGVVAGLIVGFAVWFILRTVPPRVFVGLADFSQDSAATAGNDAHIEPDVASACDNSVVERNAQANGADVDGNADDAAHEAQAKTNDDNPSVRILADISTDGAATDATCRLVPDGERSENDAEQDARRGGDITDK